MSEDLFQLSAAELGSHYHARTLSPVEVVQALLRRIEALNPRLNAFSYVAAEPALAAARVSEARWMAGQPASPLDGVPVSLKDHMAATGMLSFSGSRAANPHALPDAEDAPVAARLKEAGAVILGKTTMPDFGLVAAGVSSRFGVTRNPWNPALNSGGSSSGAAVALAAGLGPLAIGSDGGGSLRIPAAFCGVFALKPSYGRVPAHDPKPWVVAGPMARSVGDAALLMNAITRPDERDFSALPHDARDHREGLQDGVRGARIGLLPEMGFGPPAEPEVLAALQRAAELFRELGAVVQTLPPLFTEDPEPHFDRILHISTYQLFGTLSPELQDAMLPELAAWCRRENAEPKQLLMQSLVATGPIRHTTLAPFATHDFVLAPVMGMLPYAAERPWPPGAAGAHNPFCFPFNMSEQPAASVHGGFSAGGLPIGLQIIGRRFDDRGVLRAARAHEQASGFLQRRPAL